MARLTYTPVTEYLKMTMRDLTDVREALVSVLEREKAAREES